MTTTSKKTLAKGSNLTATREPACPRIPRILRIRKRMGLNQKLFSRAVGIKERTLSKLEKGQSPSEQAQRRISELDRFQAALAEVVHTEAIADWMCRPNPAFGELKPIEVIERGEIDRLWAMIYDLRSGSPA